MCDPVSTSCQFVKCNIFCVQRVGGNQAVVTFSEDNNEALCQPQLHVPGGGGPCG